jgi:hypothetical protein
MVPIASTTPDWVSAAASSLAAAAALGQLVGAAYKKSLALQKLHSFAWLCSRFF